MRFVQMQTQISWLSELKVSELGFTDKSSKICQNAARQEQNLNLFELNGHFKRSFWDIGISKNLRLHSLLTNDTFNPIMKYCILNQICFS